MISLPPEHTYTLLYCDNEENEQYIQIDAPMQPDATEEGSLFPGGIGLEFPATKTERDLAKQLVVALAISGLHEALEWVKVDGQRIATPHPLDEDSMWEWCTKTFTEIVDTYLFHWPNPEPDV